MNFQERENTISNQKAVIFEKKSEIRNLNLAVSQKQCEIFEGFPGEENFEQNPSRGGHGD
jgi:hypothetical protein